jgi:drug/metabolite transporter (DMT)-like permease
VVILSAILFKDQITHRKLAALFIAFLGCSFVTGIWSGNLSLSTWGLLLGLGSGFFYGLYSIFARFALSHYPPYTVTFYTFLFAGIGAIFIASPGETIHTLQTSRMILLALGLVMISTVLPYLFYTKGLSRIDSGKASILASIEPIVSAFVGILAFGEPMGMPVLLGLICILISIYILR